MKFKQLLYIPAIVAIVVLAGGCDREEKKHESETKPLGWKCELLSFSLDEVTNKLETTVTFTLDAETNTYSAMYLKWIDRENPEMLIPNFTVIGESVTVNGHPIESGVSSLSFADDFTITVTAENGNTKDYTISFNCPQINTELPVLHVKPERLVDSKDNYVKTGIILYDKSKGGSQSGWYEGTADMRGRGNSTWRLPKKPYRIKFPEKISPIGLDHASDKSWVILAHDMDKSLIRNHIAFEYSRIMFNPAEGYHDKDAVLFTPSSKYINVYMTGKYHYSDTGETKNLKGDYLGVYQMSDQMKRDKGRIEVDKLEAADGNDPEKITGGYILETDIHEGNRYSDKGVKFTYKYPDDDDYDPAQYEYIRDYVNMAEAVLYGPDFTDPVNGWRKYFDEKTLADFIIVKEFAGDYDAYASTYIYKRRGNDKLFFGPIWDCDKGWDNEVRVADSNYPAESNLMIYAGFRMPSNSNLKYDWFRRFWDDESFRAFVNNRWIQKKAELEAVTETLLVEMPLKMKKAIEANFTVWPFYYQYNNEAKMPAADYESEIARIRSLSKKRSTYLDIRFAE